MGIFFGGLWKKSQKLKPAKISCHTVEWGILFLLNCSIALAVPINAHSAQNPHETADIEAICMFANSFKNANILNLEFILPSRISETYCLSAGEQPHSSPRLQTP